MVCTFALARSARSCPAVVPPKDPMFLFGIWDLTRKARDPKLSQPQPQPQSPSLLSVSSHSVSNRNTVTILTVSLLSFPSAPRFLSLSCHIFPPHLNGLPSPLSADLESTTYGFTARFHNIPSTDAHISRTFSPWSTRSSLRKRLPLFPVLFFYLHCLNPTRLLDFYLCPRFFHSERVPSNFRPTDRPKPARTQRNHLPPTLPLDSPSNTVSKEETASFTRYSCSFSSLPSPGTRLRLLIYLPIVQSYLC